MKKIEEIIIASDSRDYIDGLRLEMERKKIWKSRKEFGKSTGIPSGSLENWEAKGTGISPACLRAIAENGGDITFILTGRRSPALWSDWAEFREIKGGDDLIQIEKEPYSEPVTCEQLLEKVTGYMADKMRALLEQSQNGGSGFLEEVKNLRGENAELREQLETARKINDMVQAEKLELREKLANFTKRASAG